MNIRFMLNGETVETDVPPTRTLLDWLREDRGLTGTKEGCNEGDCGACTVIVTDADGAGRSLNACILFMPQVHGRAVRTVEGIASPDGALHPVQQAMIDHHGSQCGFCTPGFVVAMAAGHAAGRRDHDDVLAGNLCRCTGYAPIIRAAEAAADAPVPHWMAERVPELAALPIQPESADALARWYADNPDAVLVGGATDVGLWVNKDLRELPNVAFLNRCRDLQEIEDEGDTLRIGAAVTMTRMLGAMRPLYPAYAELIRRYGSEQVRNAATLGGNIANGSPIGDNPPALIALGAMLHLRHGDTRRSMPMENFFLDYGKQDRAPGEFVEAVSIPKGIPDLRCYKLSKRFDQDISAVCGCFAIGVTDDTVTSARIAYGGMAGIPKRAAAMEAALLDQPWTEDTVRVAMAALTDDFTPLDDMRASAAYRREAAANMLLRAFHDRAGVPASVLEIAP